MPTLFKNHEKCLHKRAFHRTAQSLLVHTQTHGLMLTLSGKIQCDKVKLCNLCQEILGYRRNQTEKKIKQCMQGQKKNIKGHMEAGCKSRPMHTFLRGDRPTQEMATDATSVPVNTATVAQVSHVFPQMAS